MINKIKKELLIQYVNSHCELCKKKFKDLEIHRIKRGCSYNEYRSLMVICKSCHGKLHQNEFSNIQSR